MMSGTVPHNILRLGAKLGRQDGAEHSDGDVLRSHVSLKTTVKPVLWNGQKSAGRGTHQHHDTRSPLHWNKSLIFTIQEKTKQTLILEACDLPS